MSTNAEEDKKPIEVLKPETEKDSEKCCDCGCQPFKSK